MLTADLVDARKKDGELLLRSLDCAERAEALSIAAELLDAARSMVGKRRVELDEAWDSATGDLGGRRMKLAAGLRKLAADACTFESEPEVDPTELRRVLFTHASEARRTRDDFDRAAVLEEAAAILGMTPEALERAMFSDLRGEHVLRAAPSLGPEALVEAWELGQAQAVLLAAVRVTCEIESSSPGLVRALFAKLKFHQLLFSVERVPVERGDGERDGGSRGERDAGDRARPDAGERERTKTRTKKRAATPEAWRIVIDGPYSMFDAVTKYGVKLAVAFPALRALERWSLVADVRWGKAREPLVFRLSSARALGAPDEDVHLGGDARELLDAINAMGGPWRARPASALLDVPGEGVCIPDLELTREGAGSVQVEVLGFWSRAAVFRRVELAERGLRGRVIFAVSARLRVSAEVLDDAVPACLYVYKGKMSPRAILERADRLLAK